MCTAGRNGVRDGAMRNRLLDHANRLGLTPKPHDPDAPPKLVVVSSVFIDSPLMRRLRNAGTAVVESKVFLEAQRGRVLPGKRWGERST
jgi:hypothetical protein